MDRLETEQVKCPHTRLPKLATQPCAVFFSYQDDVVWSYVTSVNHILDKIQIDPQSEPTGEFRALFRFHKVVSEMLLVRVVDNFLSYVSELLALVFTSKPETLRSNETVKLEEILQYGTMEDLIQHITEKRVERLSYQGMRDLNKDLAERLGFELFLSPEDLSHAVRLVEDRNLIVHSRGIVNQTYHKRTADSTIPVGKPMELISIRRIRKETEFLARSVVSMDERAAAKFGLKRVETDLHQENAAPTDVPGSQSEDSRLDGPR